MTIPADTPATVAELRRELAVAQERIAELEALAKLYARPVIDKDGVLWIGDGVGYVSARSKEGK